MVRILITGASGFLGFNLAISLREKNEVWGTYHRNPVALDGCRMEMADVSSERELRALVARSAPDVVLHAAAVIDVDVCERERGMASLVNADGARIVARSAREAGARMVYFSTDMVFAGKKGMYTEADEARPANHYGETKLAGERHVLACCPGAVVARLALMYGAGSRAHGSFLDWMTQMLARGESVNLFTDQYRTPVYVGDVCRAVGKIIEGAAKGLYHIGGPERVNRYEFGVIMAEVYGMRARLLRPVRMKDMKGLLPRPEDTSLDNRKAAKELGIAFRGVREGLTDAMKERRDALPA